MPWRRWNESFLVTIRIGGQGKTLRAHSFELRPGLENWGSLMERAWETGEANL